MSWLAGWDAGWQEPGGGGVATEPEPQPQLRPARGGMPVGPRLRRLSHRLELVEPEPTPVDATVWPRPFERVRAGMGRATATGEARAAASAVGRSAASPGPTAAMGTARASAAGLRAAAGMGRARALGESRPAATDEELALLITLMDV